MPPEHEPRQRFWRIHRQALRRSRRSHRAAAGVRRQRPSRHHAGRRGARLSQPLCGGARAARSRVRHQRRRRRARSPTSPAPASPSRPSSIRARASPASIEAAAKAAGARAVRRRLRSRGRIGSIHVRARRCQDRGRRDGAHRLRSRVRLGRLEPVRASDLASRRPSRVERSPRGLRARRAAGRHERAPAPPTASWDWRTRWPPAPRPGCRPPPTAA